MLAPAQMSPRVRNLAAALVHRTWAWVSAVGLIGPDDARAKGFMEFGPRSGIAFPPGPMPGESRICIGARTLIGPQVSLAVGLTAAELLAPGNHPLISIAYA